MKLPLPRALALLAAVALTLPAFAQTATTTAPASILDIDPNALAVRGTVVSFNLSDKGVPEGFIMQADGGIGQVNFPRSLADTLAKAIRINDTVEVLLYSDAGPGGPGRGGPDGGPAGRGGPADGGAPDGGPAGRGGPNQIQPDHGVFKLVALRDAKGKIYDATAATDARKTAHVAGTIKAINYNNRGIPNGVQLSTGDFVRLNDRMLQQIDITVGTPFTADGNAEAMPNGRSMIQPQSINGTTLEGGGRGGPGGPDGGPGGDGPPPPPDNGPPPPPDNGPPPPPDNGPA